ncbi:NADP-dependent oxidoreductase [Levilactobacillus brevis]|nr:NADP-dependent oxidoreductase [Levilactobacillus brevis]
MTDKMRAAVIDHYHQVDPEIRLVPQPVIHPHDVLVKIRAASVNPIDTKTMAGDLRLLLRYRMPLILGSDFAGDVIAVGRQVTAFQVGDAVYGRPQKDRIGTFADYLAVDTGDIALMPTNLSYEQAAALPLVGLTSYQALHDLMALRPGKKVLIQAGSGGVETVAIQLAKQLGAYVATTTSAANTAFVQSLGADEVIDYHRTDFATVLKDYDAVFDMLGGNTLERAFRVVKPGGIIVSVSGRPNLPLWKRGVLRLATRRLTQLEKVSGVSYRFLFMQPSGQQLAELTTLVEQNKLVPVIDRIYPLTEIAAALTYSRLGKAHGKIIVTMTE